MQSGPKAPDGGQVRALFLYPVPKSPCEIKGLYDDIKFLPPAGNLIIKPALTQTMAAVAAY